MKPALVAVTALWLAACGAPQTDELTVFAASSLKAPFTELGSIYERSNPGTRVVFNFAGSSDLVAQLDQGAPADVLATADEAVRETPAGEGLGLRVFATNTMQIVVPADNPGRVDSFTDLADPELDIVVCAPQVPCGAATARIGEAAGVEISADSEEASVTDVLNKVVTGQADAGVVYRSDVVTAPATVKGIPIPPAINTRNRYPIAGLGERGGDFVDLVLSEQGQQILRGDGFGPP